MTAAVSLLAGIVEGSDDAIVAKDRDGQIISWNPAAERLFGYTEAEAIGSHVSMLVPDSHRGEDIEVFERILAGRRVEHYETRRCAKDGRLVDVAVTVSPLRDSDGTIVGASKILRDISELREVRRMQSQFAAIVENSDDAIISKDCTGHVTSWNPAAERLFGYSAEEAVGQHISFIFPPDLIGRERDILGEITQGRKVDHYETRRRTREGRVLDVALTVSPLRDPDGTIVGASKILRDITDQKLLRARERHAERLARTNERLAAADRAKDEFLAIANHELRTPLTSIAGFTDTLLNEDREFTADERREFLRIIDRQAARLTRLVDDLLELTKAQVEQSAGNVADVPVRRAIEDTLRDNDRLEIDVEGDPRVTARIDPEHLHQIIINYVDNATKYGNGRVDIAVEKDDDHAVITVTDDGPGVAEELVPRLFEAFSRSQAARDAQVPGTGLGLSIVRSLARTHDGDAWHEPARGGGSAFRVRLPLGVPRLAAAPDPPDASLRSVSTS